MSSCLLSSLYYINSCKRCSVTVLHIAENSTPLFNQTDFVLVLLQQSSYVQLTVVYNIKYSKPKSVADAVINDAFHKLLKHFSFVEGHVKGILRIFLVPKGNCLKFFNAALIDLSVKSYC